MDVLMMIFCKKKQGFLTPRST